LGDLVYRYITSGQFFAKCLLDCLDLSYVVLFMGDELILYYYIIVNNTSKNNKKAQKKTTKKNMKN